MRRFAPAFFSLLAACAAQPPLPPHEEARLHCQAQIFQMRVGT